MNQNMKYQELDWAIRIQEWKIPWVSGIYPGEMAAFLALCDKHKVKTIVESGRGEGDSTHILSEYARRQGAKVISIDWELHPEITERCRLRLSAYPQTVLLKGDAMCLLPVAFSMAEGPFALIMDGPKFHLANKLSLVAACLYDVAVVAHHNCTPGTPWREAFGRMFRSARNAGDYQWTGSSIIESRWVSFKDWEKEWVRGSEIPSADCEEGRNLDRSSLAIAEVAPSERSLLRLLRFQSVSFRANPLLLAMMWAIKNRRYRPKRSR